VNDGKVEGPPFRISTKAELCNLLSVSPGLVGHVISRVDHYYVKDPRPKPNGGVRTLYKPLGRLCEIQSAIKSSILGRIPPLPFVHGGIRKRSIQTNARPHIGKEAVLAVDIRDCFPSIGPERVLKVLNELGVSGEAALILRELTTFDFQLPQGPCTSPAIANLVLRPVDHRLNALAHKHGLSYTRFMDDIIISGTARVGKFRGLVHKILESEGFKLKAKKELMLQSERQVVTKLVVNRKPNVPKERRAEIRREAVQQVNSGQGQLSPSTIGKLVWVKSINKEVGSKLLSRFRPA